MAASSSSIPSSFSISSSSQRKYDVFLSFRGEDTRNTLVDFLYYALKWRGISIFKDDVKLEGGKTIKPELLKAIEESRFAVVVLSENYASSTWCLDELVKIVDCEKEKGMTVLPIFYNVNPSDVRKQTGTFAKAFDEHENQFNEKVGRWREALYHVAGIAGHHQDKNRPLSEAVKWIVGELSHISSFEFSPISQGLVGIETRLVELQSCLASKDDVRFIGIWAMGGMGKSTLAGVVYEMFSKEFEASCFINVREGDELSLQKDLIDQILLEKNLVKNKYDGADMIKRNLWNKKVLLVLDDVDESKKLKMLVRKSDRFGSGSRIIITTRNKHLLKDFPLDEDEIFEVKPLNHKDALCLFCSKAFKKEQCPDEYLELTQRFLEYVSGLPLALEVMGSFLFEKSTAEWKIALEMLKEDPGQEINQVLKISFDELPDPVKDIFLDIACFFNHEGEDHVVRMLNSIGRHSKIGLHILTEKSLLKISEYNKLWMHNLIEDMGRNMVRKESLEPGERSRLYRYEDIVHVMKNNTGTGKVQAIDIKGGKDTRIYHEEKEACSRPQWLAPLMTLQGWVLSTLSCLGFTSSMKPEGLLWNPNAFLKMHNLKFLRIRSISVQLDTSRLPNNLSYLECNDYPLKSLHSLPAGLVELRLLRSKIELLWGGMKNFDRLKSINMAGSSNLIKVLDFNGVPMLEELVLEGCSKLRTLDPSIGKLKNLKRLNLKKCQELTSLPNKFEWEFLVTLNLTGCSKVKRIPEFVENMKHLQELLLEGTAIIELPSSVEYLTGLNSLILKNCKNLVRLPNICSLRSLDNLNLFGCSKFDKLPEDLGNITSLKGLDLSGTAVMELPSSIVCLTGLKALALKDCKKFVLLPSTVCSLKSLMAMYLSRCPKFVNLPENLGNLEHLRVLCFEGTAIEVLPSSVGHLAALEDLNLKHCKNLVCLPSTICNLKRVRRLNLTGCSKISNLPENLGNMESLNAFYLGGTAINELPSSTIHLNPSMFGLSFKGCQLSSSSFTSMPGGCYIDLSDCNLSAIPSGIYRNRSQTNLYLSGNDFVSLPESSFSQFSSQFSYLRRLYLDGCKSLRSLSNIQIPSSVEFLCVDNCTSLESLPEDREPPDDFFIPPQSSFTVQCFNCFKLAENFENFSNLFQGQNSQQFNICCIIPGREIPKWFEEVNICDTSVDTDDMYNIYKTKKVKIQLPGSGTGCDEWSRIVLCVVFLPIELNHRCQLDHRYEYLLSHRDRQKHVIRVKFVIGSWNYYRCYYRPEFSSEYGEVESPHLWLHSLSKKEFCLPKTPGRYIDKKGFHQVELEIQTQILEVEKIGFCVV